MQSGKSLRRPISWQEFETLCKKLWGEIWNCPEIKKNGRNGQLQNGVDIYGIPLGETEYFGIQCKAKDENLSKEITENEVVKEIENATGFKPALKKLYIATTSSKSSSIEQFVRVQNLENISKGLFEVHLFCWEDIVDLIDENKQTLNFYLKSVNYKSRQLADLNFKDGTKEVILTPKFKENVLMFQNRNSKKQSDDMFPFAKAFGNFPLIPQYGLSQSGTNLSYSSLVLRLSNSGTDPIEDFKIFFDLDENVKEVATSNLTGLWSISSVHHRANLKLFLESHSGQIEPHNKILVSDDFFDSDEIFLKPIIKECASIIKWRLISKDYKTEGELKILFRPEIVKRYKTKILTDGNDVPPNEISFSDFITTEN